MSTDEVDVVIVGAGISGLTAARYILNKDPNLNVVVLEGKDRVGGRTLSVKLQTDTGTDTWDAGAQWVGRCQTHIMGLIGDLGLQVHQQYLTGRKFIQVGKDNSVRSYTSDIPTLSWLGLLDLSRTINKVESIAKEVDPLAPYTCKRAQEWDEMTLETFIKQNMWMEESKQTLRAALTSVYGVDISQISALYFFMYVASAGSLTKMVEATPYAAQEYVVQGGTQQISQLMMKEIGESKVRLGEPVLKVIQQQDKVKVMTDKGKTYSCRKLILAIPPNQTGKILFDPLLPTVKRELIKRMPMANYIKVIITYKEAFWRTDGKSGEVVTNGGASHVSECRAGPMCIVFDDTSPSGSPALVGFIAANQAVEWRQVEPETRKAAVLKSLAEFFGEKIHEPIEYMEKDWDTEPFSDGAPVCCVAPGAMRYYASGHKEPAGNIHLAGTESATVWCGYMSGAVQAGNRAAIEVLMHLRPQLVSMKDLQDNNKHDINSQK